MAGARGEVGIKLDNGGRASLRGLMHHAKAFGCYSKSIGSSLANLKQRSDPIGLASLEAPLGLPCRERTWDSGGMSSSPTRLGSVVLLGGVPQGSRRGLWARWWDRGGPLFLGFRGQDGKA